MRRSSVRGPTIACVACIALLGGCGEGDDPATTADAASEVAPQPDAGNAEEDLDTSEERVGPADVPSASDTAPPADVPGPVDIAPTEDGEVTGSGADEADGDAQEEILASDGGDGDGQELGEVSGDAENLDDTGIIEDVAPPQPIGPIAWYSFESTEGPVLDGSGNELHGTATGWGVARGEPGVNAGLAIAFDGTGGRVIIAESELFKLSDGFTMEAWVKPTSITEQHTVLHMGKANGNEISVSILPGDWGLGEESGVGARLQASISAPFPSLNNDLTVVNATDTSVGPEGGWFHVAITNDGQYMKLYGNGQILKVGEHGYYMDDMEDEDVRIGGDDYNGTVPHPFIGLVDEVKWWNVARTFEEICTDLGGFSNGAGGCGMPAGP